MKRKSQISTLDFNLTAEQKKKKVTREVKFMVFFHNFEVYSLEKQGTSNTIIFWLHHLPIIMHVPSGY